MRPRLVVIGSALWVVATLALRLGVARLLPNAWAAVVALFAASAIVCAWLVRRVCRSSHLERGAWPVAAVSLLLPTLVLDPFSSAFYTHVFPDANPAGAGVFGGWMLACCAGALIGTAGTTPR